MRHKKKFTLGIYGDGQLARLLALRASKKQLSILIFTLDAINSPCKGLGELQQGKSWTDKESFESFSQLCETVVLENEFVPSKLLLEAESRGIRVFPNAQAYKKVDNKLKQVELCNELKVTVPAYEVVNHPSDLAELKLPVVLKSLTGGYDGYGNFSLTNMNQLPNAQEFISRVGSAIAQEFIHFDMEVAVIVASDGNYCYSFPVVETIQENHICHFVLTPPRVSEKIQSRIKNEAEKIIQSIGGVGVFGVEFFVKGEEVIFNEIAPRTHNSGHYSIEACNFSQFDALIKLIIDEPLSRPTLKIPVAGMLNLLGTHNGKANFEGDEAFEQGFLHLYGKENSRIGRKMGHFTLLGMNQAEVLRELSYLKTRYQI